MTLHGVAAEITWRCAGFDAGAKQKNE